MYVKGDVKVIPHYTGTWEMWRQDSKTYIWNMSICEYFPNCICKRLDNNWFISSLLIIINLLKSHLQSSLSSTVQPLFRCSHEASSSFQQMMTNFNILLFAVLVNIFVFMANHIFTSGDIFISFPTSNRWQIIAHGLVTENAFNQ
jgi:hypothetical protein